MVVIGSSDNRTVSGQINSMEMATVIFLFIIGLCSFKESFGLMIQNGISRRTLFTGRLLTTLTIALLMATFDKVFLVLLKFYALTKSETLYCSSLYEQLYYKGFISGMGSFSMHVSIFLFDFFIYIFIMSIGYFITLLFYRLNKAGQIAVGVGVPVSLCIALPLYDSVVANGKIFLALGKFFDFAFGLSAHKPNNANITSVLGFIIISCISWMLIRRVPAKEQRD
jgi:hypothetical protein